MCLHMSDSCAFTGDAFRYVLSVTSNPAQVGRSEGAPESKAQQVETGRACALTVFDHGLLVRVVIYQLIQMLRGVAKARREDYEVGLKPLAILQGDRKSVIADRN